MPVPRPPGGSRMPRYGEGKLSSTEQDSVQNRQSCPGEEVGRIQTQLSVARRLPSPTPSSRDNHPLQCREGDISNQKQGRSTSPVAKRLCAFKPQTQSQNKPNRDLGHHPIQILISQMSKVRPKRRRALPQGRIPVQGMVHHNPSP